MSKLVLDDIESFLYELGTLKENAPGSFERYSRLAAMLLYDKYCLLEDPTIQILPDGSSSFLIHQDDSIAEGSLRFPLSPTSWALKQQNGGPS
jgi:hypothetical protein